MILKPVETDAVEEKTLNHRSTNHICGIVTSNFPVCSEQNEKQTDFRDKENACFQFSCFYCGDVNLEPENVLLS